MLPEQLGQYDIEKVDAVGVFAVIEDDVNILGTGCDVLIDGINGIARTGVELDLLLLE